MLFSRASQVPDGSSTARRIDHRLKKQGWTPESLSCHTGPNMELSPCPENGLYKRKHNVTYYLTYLYVACDISDIGDSQSHWPWEFPTATGWTPRLSCRAQQRINKEWCAEMTWNDKGSETAKRHMTGDRCNGWELTTPMDSQLLHLISVMFLTERKRAMWIFSSESLPLPWNIHCFHLLQCGYEPLFFVQICFYFAFCWRYPLLRSLKKP